MVDQPPMVGHPSSRADYFDWKARQPSTVILILLASLIGLIGKSLMVPMNERYAVTVEIFLDGNQWGALLGGNITVGVAGFGYSANEAMLELTKQMEVYQRNWKEFADREHRSGGIMKSSTIV